MSSSLRASVYVAPPVPFRKPNGQPGGSWSPIACTMIHAEKEALLVDTPITREQNTELADWVEATLAPGGKRLTTIYVSHGHADHWLGINYFKKRFPGVKAVATPGTIAHMKEDIEPKKWKATYGTQFPGEIDEDFVLAEPLPSNNEIHLGGHVLKAIEVGHSDTHDTTVLWVPSIKLAVCGDVVYGDVHQMLAAANTKALREEWIRAVETIEALGPEQVVGGHIKADELHGTYHLRNTKEYIRTFGELLEAGAKDSRDLFAKMKARYPTRYNDGALIMGCMAAFSKKQAARM